MIWFFNEIFKNRKMPLSGMNFGWNLPFDIFFMGEPEADCFTVDLREGSIVLVSLRLILEWDRLRIPKVLLRDFTNKGEDWLGLEFKESFFIIGVLVTLYRVSDHLITKQGQNFLCSRKCKFFDPAFADYLGLEILRKVFSCS